MVRVTTSFSHGQLSLLLLLLIVEEQFALGEITALQSVRFVDSSDSS